MWLFRYSPVLILLAAPEGVRLQPVPSHPLIRFLDQQPRDQLVEGIAVSLEPRGFLVQDHLHELGEAL